jgi:tRNA wybutosine-synthesizing protein 2
MRERRQQDPIRTAVQTWLASLPADQLDTPSADQLLSLTPKRFVIYEPMAQLPSGSFSLPPWTAVLRRQPVELRIRLWTLILEALSKRAGSTLTHLAVTAGIPLHNEAEEENILRSPSGLQMLHGDFGPASPKEGREPGTEDFERALWVSTRQNGIWQTWAPRWTMFSRGNVKEKARLLSFPSAWGSGDNIWAVDLYAGIGYFVFSYASLGMRILCWEINPWSIEGLRRGALANRWTVKILQGAELETAEKYIGRDGPQIIVFAEDNQRALDRIRGFHEHGLARAVKHVNCGFLPTSEPSWRTAWEVTARSGEAWLHLHENVGGDDISHRKQALTEQYFSKWSAKEGMRRRAEAQHVELVKTFAPGVWHCVFDVHIMQ